MKTAEAKFETVVDPRAVIGRGATFGEGAFAFANVVGNVDTTIGPNCILDIAYTRWRRSNNHSADPRRPLICDRGWRYSHMRHGSAGAGRWCAGATNLTNP
jgi:hypothetical protein